MDEEEDLDATGMSNSVSKVNFVSSVFNLSVICFVVVGIIIVDVPSF